MDEMDLLLVDGKCLLLEFDDIDCPCLDESNSCLFHPELDDIDH